MTLHIYLMMSLLGIFISVQAGPPVPFTGYDYISPTAPFVPAIPDTLDLPYPVKVMQFDGTLDGHVVQLNGTVQEIFAQMKIHYPGFDSERVIANTTVIPRAVSNKIGLICCPVWGQSWTRCDPDQIWWGEKHLSAIDELHVPSRSCSRVSCSWGSAIWICNDSTYDLSVSGSYVASFGHDVVYGCGGNACGQEFESAEFNVIVRADSC